ncbi:S-adenosyl-L-methionine-dependent methyltransferase [Tribonema minus]|uniref:tRNA (guanine(26)-N(2))-dimethyltransferase n=1 Tax=Tribonema minus TaxID=303371 RepID=A0A835Z9D7_9STRA|nr:S-adenosyl-L-methionine-dependent methyltransferase [Tribonema minus]
MSEDEQPPQPAVIREGAAVLLPIPKGVFFNSHQLLQRDLSVAVLQTLSLERAQQQPLRVCDALAGCGIRALRYALECGWPTQAELARSTAPAEEEAVAVEAPAASATAPSPLPPPTPPAPTESAQQAPEPAPPLEPAAPSPATAAPPQPSHARRAACGVSVTAVDASPAAAAAIAANARANGLATATATATATAAAAAAATAVATAHFQVHEGDACAFLRAHARAFDFVDVDPFGSPMPFAAAALAAVTDGGVVALAATDMQVLCGRPARACAATYACWPPPMASSEVALRVLLRAVAAAARQQGRRVQPLVCVALQFYVRVFLRVTTADGAECDAPTHAGSSAFGRPPPLPPPPPPPPPPSRLPPPLASAHVLAALLAALAGELRGALLSHALPATARAARVRGLRPGRGAVLRALSTAGHACSGSHADPQGIKTNAGLRAVMAAVKAACVQRRAGGHDARAGICMIHHYVRPRGSQKPVAALCLCAELRAPTQTHDAPSEAHKQTSHADAHAAASEPRQQRSTLNYGPEQHSPPQQHQHHRKKRLRLDLGFAVGDTPVRHHVGRDSAQLNASRRGAARGRGRGPPRGRGRGGGGSGGGGSGGGGAFGNMAVVHGREGSLLLSHCEVKGGGAFAGAGLCAADGALLQLHACRVEGGRGAGVFVCGKGRAVLSDCVIAQAGAAGLEVRGGGSAAVSGCSIQGCARSGVFAHGLSTQLQLSDSTVSDSTYAGVELSSGATAQLAHCSVLNSRRGGVLVIGNTTASLNCRNSTPPLPLPGVCAAAALHRCSIAQSRMAGVAALQSSTVRLSHCHVRGGGASGVVAQAHGSASAEHCLVIGNRLAALEAGDGGAIVSVGCALRGNGIGDVGTIEYCDGDSRDGESQAESKADA